MAAVVRQLNRPMGFTSGELLGLKLELGVVIAPHIHTCSRPPTPDDDGNDGDREAPNVCPRHTRKGSKQEGEQSGERARIDVYHAPFCFHQLCLGLLSQLVSKRASE